MGWHFVLFYLAAISTLAIFVAAGTFIGTRTSDPKDYSLGGRKSSAAGVTGILLGALVGGHPLSALYRWPTAME